ncbi:MAG TPA: VOC family protein [Steroidobacteraceae bacterium]|nr:VOC family protein [Steroidobacteraceae bacterium]
MKKITRIAAFLAIACAAPLVTCAQTTDIHFHHLHLNTVDPQRAIDFYTTKFEARKARFAGMQDAVWAHDSWILFTKVAAAPPWELVSPVWHFGWGAEDMKAEFRKQTDSGTQFFAPLTKLSPDNAPTEFFYAYVQSPDHALIELNTADHHHFGHVHLFSADPVSAGEWYMKHLGATRRGATPASREPRFRNDLQIGPSMSLMSDHVNLIIYPVEYSKKAYADHWKSGQTTLVTSRGRTVDHLGFSVPDLDQTLAALRKDGVKVTAEPRSIANGQIKFAFVEGPDQIPIELIEDHTGKPQ